MVILLPYIDYKSSHSSSFLFCTNDCKNGENFPVIINDLLDRQFIHPTVFKIFDILTKWVSSVIRQIFVFALRRLRWRYGRSFSDEFRNMQRNRNIIDSPKNVMYDLLIYTTFRKYIAQIIVHQKSINQADLWKEDKLFKFYVPLTNEHLMPIYFLSVYERIRN